MAMETKVWPEVMNLMQASAYLGFHPVTMREWKRKGEGPPGKKIGGRWRFHKPALDAYLAGTKERPLRIDVPSLREDRQRAPTLSFNPRLDPQYMAALGLDPDDAATRATQLARRQKKEVKPEPTKNPEATFSHNQMWFTVPEAARYLRQSLRKFTELGIEAHGEGARKVYHRSVLDAAMLARPWLKSTNAAPASISIGRTATAATGLRLDALVEKRRRPFKARKKPIQDER